MTNPLLNFSSSPPPIKMIEVDVVLTPGQPPTRVIVPANSPEEAYGFLQSVGDGTTAGVAYGSVLSPIRDAYKRQLSQVEMQIISRRAALGPNPTDYELRGLAQWAARQRTMTARLWRIPLPVTGVGLEVRDWRIYGPGGRTFDNLMTRNAQQGRTGTAAYEAIVGSATRSNPAVNASVARGATFLKGGGAVLGVAGLGFSAYDVWQAPEAQRGQVATRHGIGFAGGLIGAEVAGGLLAVGAGLLLATPPGWLIIGVGLVGGIAGAMIADHIFYPDDYRPVAEQLGAGFAVDPRSPIRSVPGPVGSMGRTTLPVIETVSIVVQSGDTDATLQRRAMLQAAASVGMAQVRQIDFADRHAGNGRLQWASGDPSPQDDQSVRPGDIETTAGKRIAFRLSPAQRAELEALASQ